MPEKRKAVVPTLVFNHAMVYVRELAPALRFYVDLLGFKVIEEVPPAYARLRSPRAGATLALHIVEPGQALPETGGVRLYFETRELGRLCKNLEAAGVRFSQPPKMMPWGWSTPT